MDCHYCGSLLTNTSPHDDYRVRRADSTFCDDQCRTNYHNARRKYLRKLAALQQIRQDIHDIQRELQFDPEPLPALPDDGKQALRDFLKALTTISPIDMKGGE